MLAKGRRLRIGEDGSLEVIDPTCEDIELLCSVDPSFRVRQQPLPGFERPRALATRLQGVGVRREALPQLTVSALWAAHNLGMRQLRTLLCRKDTGNEASLIDIKIELARRILKSCDLCARECRIDRWNGRRGACGLGVGATVVEAFTHIAEEPPINPSLVVSLAGCGLRCRFCQKYELLCPDAVGGRALDESLWQDLDPFGARSVSFLGGNPDESLYAVLRCLSGMPEDWRLPVVWNSHAFVPLSTIWLLDGIVDAYLPDLKYGSDRCGQRLSGIADYPATTLRAIGAMLEQDVPVIVRLLVLPGHRDCCHEPALKRLAELRPVDQLLLSVRGQYAPDWQITQADGELARRTTKEEVASIREAAQAVNLRLVD
ncbi:MAG: hypothetical protein WAS73_04220 [Defluviicoccus sp.]